MFSQAALGKDPREDDPEILRRWQGIPLFDTVERAQRVGKRSPWNGNAYIATLVIQPGQFHIEQTGRRGHYPLWGEQHDFPATVTDVQPIQNVASERIAQMIYGFWDIETNNLVADFDNKRDALALVLRAIERNGPQDVDTLALDVEDEDGEGHLIAFGKDLLELAKCEFSSDRIAG